MSNTGTNISIIEKNLPMDRIGPLVEAINIDKKRFLATVMLACERQPKLMDHHVSEHVQWASAAAALGLEPDGVSGQAFPIPFGGRNPKVQLIIGYKGFNTMAGRAGISISSGTIYEGDEWDTTLHAGKPFAIRQSFGSRNSSKLLGVWAQAQLPNGFFAHPLIMDMSEILAVKAKSPGARKSDSPWNDVAVGLPAMAQKTPVRRLQRTLPSLITPGRNFSTHAAGMTMETAHEEQGLHSTVDLDGNVRNYGPIDVTPTPEETEIAPTIIAPDGSEMKFGTFPAYSSVVKKIGMTENLDALRALDKSNRSRFADWRASGDKEATAAADAIEIAISERIKAVSEA